LTPTLTEEEVITMAICGEYFKCGTDKNGYTYFRAHYRHFYPRLTDWTLFVRQAANLWQVKTALPAILILTILGQPVVSMALRTTIGCGGRYQNENCYALQQCLTLVSGQAADPVQVMDTLSLPVREYTRSAREQCFKPNANYGYCAAQDLHYDGFKPWGCSSTSRSSGIHSISMAWLLYESRKSYILD
jgi:hypothetical protein